MTTKKPEAGAVMSETKLRKLLNELAAQNAVKERTVDEKPVTTVENEPYEEDVLTDEEIAKEAGEE